jgi:hypothetical protein
MNRRDVLKTTALAIGYAISSSALADVFISCKSEAKVNLSWKPVFLSEKQANTISEITETILPKTQTPGAKEIGVPQFIDKMLKDLLSPEDQKSFLADLEKMDDSCKSTYGKSFVECTPQQREEFLLKLDKEAAKSPPSVWGITLAAPSPTPFYRRLKSLTLFGYFTSQEIGEKHLNFDPVPGPFQGCIPLAQAGNGNIWNE